MNLIKYISLVVLAIALVSCGHNHKEGDDHDHGHDHSSHTEADGHDHSSHAESDSDGHDDGVNGALEEGGLHLSQEQATTVGLKFDDFTSIKVNDFVKATGVLGLPASAQSSISAKANGIIRGTKKFVEGGYVKKGEVIAHLENPDFMATQQEYLEIQAELALQRLAVDRQKMLVDGNAGILSDLQQAEAKARILSTKANGISKQLEYLGIPTNDLSSNNILDRIAITSPASGYISEINFHNGMYAERSTTLMDIISSQHLHLELDVFENDIAKVKQGLKISYNVPALGNKMYEGTVNMIGKEFDGQAKTVRVHGHLEGDKPQFIKDLFINAKIWLTNSTVDALPEKAVITDGATSFIFVANDNAEAEEIEFEKLSVITGSTSDGYTAVKLVDTIPTGMKIVTEGAYYIYAQSKVGELAHEH